MEQGLTLTFLVGFAFAIGKVDPPFGLSIHVDKCHFNLLHSRMWGLNLNHCSAWNLTQWNLTPLLCLRKPYQDRYVLTMATVIQEVLQDVVIMHPIIIVGEYESNGDFEVRFV